MTRDIDLVVELNPSTGAKLANTLEPDYYISQEAVNDAVVRLSMFNAINNEFIVKVDFVVRQRTEYRMLELSGGIRKKSMGHRFG